MTNKYFRTIFCICTLLFSTAAFAQNADCDVKEIKKQAIDKLSPYHYSMSIISDGEDIRGEEIEIPLLKGEQYKLVFNTSAFSENVIVEIFDGPEEDSKREMLFNSEDNSNKLFSYEPKKSKTLYLNYRENEELENSNGCVALIIGYQLNF